MEREFVNYEQAIALQELGFNEECFGYYGANGSRLSREFHCYNSDYSHLLAYAAAPLYQQAFRFFREKFKASGEVCIEANRRNDPNKWMFNITYLERNTYSHSETTYLSYEEAELACLNKLIEIIKSK